MRKHSPRRLRHQPHHRPHHPRPRLRCTILYLWVNDNTACLGMRDHSLRRLHHQPHRHPHRLQALDGIWHAAMVSKPSAPILAMGWVKRAQLRVHGDPLDRHPIGFPHVWSEQGMLLWHQASSPVGALWVLPRSYAHHRNNRYHLIVGVDVSDTRSKMAAIVASLGFTCASFAATPAQSWLPFIEGNVWAKGANIRVRN